MPKAYLIAHIRISDQDRFDAFLAQSNPVIREYGGRIMVRNPSPETVEGTLRGLVTMIEFDDMAAARRFYHSDGYTTARRLRELCADTDMLLVEGV